MQALLMLVTLGFVCGSTFVYVVDTGTSAVSWMRLRLMRDERADLVHLRKDT